jgi:tRNA (Thr-GGU) A37 N-methylase
MRTPHRPNPICVSRVDVLRRDGREFLVRGLEAIDGTPILDLKSAAAEYEGWTSLPRAIP